MLKFIFDTEADIPEAFKPYYKETDGKWILECEGAAPAAKVAEFRQNNIDLKKRLEAFEGIDPKDIGDIKRKASEYDTLKSDVKDKIEEAVQKRLATVKEDHDKETGALRTENDGLKKQLSGLQIDQAIITQATELGLRKTASADMVARARAAWRLEDGKPVAYDEQGEKIYGRNGEPITMKEWSERLAKDAPHLFEASSGSGAGGGGGGGGGGDTDPNPWKAETWNITKQGQMFKADPEKARRMAAAAGKKIA